MSHPIAWTVKGVRLALEDVRRVAANPALLEPAREMMRELGIVDTCG